MLKVVFKLTIAALAMMVCAASNAHARVTYVAPLNAALGNGASISCNACHIGTPSGNNATYSMANTYRSGIDLAKADSDNDGFANQYEVNGAATDFNSASTNPFTLAKAAESSNSSKVVVTGAGIVSETTITDPYTQVGITVPAGSEIVSAVIVGVPSFPATLTFAKAVPNPSKVYVVNQATKTNTLLNVGITYNANGSVTVANVAGPADIVVERVIPIPPTAGTGAQPVGEGKEGCMISSTPRTLLLGLMLLCLSWCTRKRLVSTPNVSM